MHFLYSSSAIERCCAAVDGSVQVEELPSDTQFEQAAGPSLLDAEGSPMPACFCAPT